MDSSIAIFHHKDHREWLKLVDFYQEQIMIFQKELALVLHRHNDLFSIIEHVDEYRKILLKKLEVLDNLRQQIVFHEKQLAENLDPNAFEIWDHNEVRRVIEEFTKDYETLKKGFRKFTAHNL